MEGAHAECKCKIVQDNRVQESTRYHDVAAAQAVSGVQKCESSLGDISWLCDLAVSGRSRVRSHINSCAAKASVAALNAADVRQHI